MENTNKLIVPSYKKNLQQWLIFMPIMILMASFLIYVLNFFTYDISPYVGLTIIFCIKILLYSVIGLFAYIGICAYLFVDANAPVAILDENGIWTKRHGLVPWENVDQVKTYSLPTVKDIEYVGIYVKDIKLLSKQSTWLRKMGIFWEKIFRYDKLFNYPNVVLANIAISNDEVIQFARQFVPEKN